MKKTYIIPIVMVDVAEVSDALLITSIKVSDETGNEEYVKKQTADDGIWEIDW